MVVLNVTYNLKNINVNGFYKVLNDLAIPQKSRAEEGNLKYQYFASIEEDNCLFLLEHWVDEVAFENHCKSSHFLALQNIKSEYVESVILNKYLV